MGDDPVLNADDFKLALRRCFAAVNLAGGCAVEVSSAVKAVKAQLPFYRWKWRSAKNGRDIDIGYLGVGERLAKNLG